MTRRYAGRRRKGSTLIEVMISMGIVLVGMLVLFGVLGTSISGSSTASRVSQAETRAITILESIRHSPPLALSCLAQNIPANWSACEQVCLNALTQQNFDGCIYTMSRFSIVHAPGQDMGQAVDRSLQLYSLNNYSGVHVAGQYNNVYDIDVVISWNDNNTDSSSTVAGTSGYHSVHLRTGVFPVQ